MKYYGDIDIGCSEKEKLFRLNRQRNLDGWFDKIFEHFDLRQSEKLALLAGDAIYAENDNCKVRCQMTMTGDMVMLICRKGETKCVTIDRLSGAKKVDFYFKQPFGEEVDNADDII